MIALILTDVPFEQDIRELFMAFYPGEYYVHEADDAAGITFTAEPAEEAPQTAAACAADSASAGDPVGTPADARGAQAEVPETDPDADPGTACGIYRMRISEAGKPEQRFSSVRYSVRLSSKNALKRALYLALKKRTGHGLPWGTLTGIRPTKIALTELSAGVPEEEVSRMLERCYFLTGSRNALCVRTAAHEKRALAGLDLTNGWSLYIGIPFCPTTCLYCSFTSYPIGLWKKRIDSYIDALIRELRAVSGWMKGRELQTVYMGGGTPTSIEAEQLSRILSAVEELFDLSKLRELTVEAGRPDSITEEKLLALKQHHVTRISINPQTLKQETLDLIGRFHTVEQFVESFHLARRLGFDNINTDLIVGLPNEDEDDVRHTMEGIRALGPDDVTIHSLALKRAARLNTKKEDYADVHYGNAANMVSLTSEFCEDMGLSPYYLYRQKNMAGNLENVGWCRPGHEGLYNILIMEEKETIVGCGAGTTTRVVFPGEDRYERVENVKDPALYIERLEEMISRKRKLLSPDSVGKSAEIPEET